MEKLRPRLLKTYVGRRGRKEARGEGAAGGPSWGLRRLPLSGAWITPQLDRRRFFSTSSSSGEVSSPGPSPLHDPDFLPRRKRYRRRQKGNHRGTQGEQQQKPTRAASTDSSFCKPPRKGRKRGKENTDPQKGGALPAILSSDPHKGHDIVIPKSLCRNVTQRQHNRRDGQGRPLHVKQRTGLWSRPSLLCSTPQPPLLTPVVAKGKLVQEEGDGSGPSSCVCCQEIGRYNCQDASDDAFPELSLLKMDRDGERKELGDSLELLGHEASGSMQQEALKREQMLHSPVSQWRLKRPLCTPLQNHFTSTPHIIWSKEEASSEKWKELATSPRICASNPVRSPGQPVQAANNDCAEKQLSPRSQAVLQKTSSHGACQLQANLCDGKIALSMPKCAPPLTSKIRKISIQVETPADKTIGDLNGALSDEENNCRIDQMSSRLQPVVVLDNQVVPNWLAGKSTRKQAAGCIAQEKGCSLQPDFPCAPSGLPSPKSSSRVAPICDTGIKACISGFNSSRWGQQSKLRKTRHSIPVKWKQQADASHFQERLKSNKMGVELPLQTSDYSFHKNSGLWRRIRASLSLHKKKKILSEVESFNGSIFSTPAVPSHISSAHTTTPFTQKLRYSICPASSMVLLSAMKSFSILEGMPTDEEKVYGECQQTGPISFEQCIPPTKMQKCEKIGEGVFGEVFRTDNERGAVALKIIPIEGSDRVNGEPQKTFSEILPEVIISKELSLLADGEDNRTSGFIRLCSVHCVQGAYPEHLLKAWDEYHRLRDSENDRPDFFGDQQLFMVLEFEFGGTDLENMRYRQLNSVVVGKSILAQVTASLAVAEEALHFEHRDLHWGNVLIRKTSFKELSFTLNGEKHTLPTHGVLVNIIDYTFSRLDKDGLTVFCDLSTDEEVFQGNGDYQFDIYRKMREENANSWADYFPHSNILWLHYLADKLLEVSYKKKPTTSSLRQVQRDLQLFSKEVLSFKSATDLLNANRTKLGFRIISRELPQ